MDDFKEKMILCTRALALRVPGVCRLLHGKYELEHVGKQLLRAATGVASNIRAVYHAKSSLDFAAKYKLCEERAVLTCFWLDFIVAGNLSDDASLPEL